MLTIFSASAGTGKTHILTGKYLSLLFKGEERYRHILAVTFTNKATAEMKNRIIEELFYLADDLPSEFLGQLSENGKKTEADIRKQARCILRKILHDYSAFHISTIDHFFQQTLRAFTREIGLQGNYQIALEKDLMLEQSVESMFTALEKNENKELMKWLLQFAEYKIEEDGGWDIRYNIFKLGKQLFKETYKTHNTLIQNEIDHQPFLLSYLDKLNQIIYAARNKAKEFGKQGVLLMMQHDLNPSDLKDVSRSPFHFFQKLMEGGMDEPTKTFRNLVDDVEKYTTKKTTQQIRDNAERMYENGMNELIKSVISFFDNLTDYNTANEIAHNFYALGILTHLTQHLAKWRADNNTLLIEDTNELLHNIINGNEIPFIYEKTGVRIEHYMIDEFQDTSNMQWSNFRPLLKDSLDNGRNNLIVGDVKQSIYRFRNSDWKLLDKQVKSDFNNQVIEMYLDVNWRSNRHIVELNNMLFDTIPKLLQQAYNVDVEQSALSPDEKESNRTCIESAYKNTKQQVAPLFMQHDGHVRIQFISDNEEQQWKEQSLQQLPHIIEQLQDNGYTLRDIAILTRTKAEGLLVAETLLNHKEAYPESHYKYDIITEDSLTVGSSLSVRWMITMIKYINQPDNDCYREMAQAACAILKMKNQGVQLENGWPQKSDTPQEAPSYNRFFQSFSPGLIEQLKQLSHHSLYDLVEGLYRLFESDLPENELIYIQALFDIVTEFTTSESAETGRFLSWWDEVGCTKKIITPDTQNAIRIMTIHKSKGLGFKVVILPFADWKVDQKEAILWCRPSRKPFNTLRLVPVRYVKALQKTIFAADYFTEKLYAYIDNLNALYVAFTRAKETLIVMAPVKKTETTTIASLLYNTLCSDQQFVLDTESGLYERGKWVSHVGVANPTGEALNEPGNKSSTQFPIEECIVERYYSLSPDKRLTLRLGSKGNKLERRSSEKNVFLNKFFYL